MFRAVLGGLLLLALGAALRAAEPDGGLGTGSPLFTSREEVLKAVPTPAGGWIVLGTFNLADGTPTKGVARLQSDGAVDPTFRASFSGNAYDTIARLQPDGKILLATTLSQFQARVVRLLADGREDPTFSAFDEYLSFSDLRISVDLQGRIYHLNLDAASGNVRIVRRQADGAIDPGFAPIARRDLALGPDGRLYGRLVPPEPGRERLVRYSDSGLPEPGDSFPWPDSFSPLTRIVPLLQTADGKTVVAGYTGVVVWVLRLLPGGQLDPSFTPPYFEDVEAISASALAGSGLRLLRMKNPDRGYPRGFVITDLDATGQVVSNDDFPVTDPVLGTGAEGTVLTFSKTNTHERLDVYRAGVTGPTAFGGLHRFQSDQSYVAGAAFHPDGRRVVWGFFAAVDGYPVPGIVQIEADGSINHPSRQALLDRLGYGFRNVQAGVAAPDGSTILRVDYDLPPRGTLVTYGTALRLLADGSLDSAWGENSASGHVYFGDCRLSVDGTNRLFRLEINPASNYSGQGGVLWRTLPSGGRDLSYTPQLPRELASTSPGPALDLFGDPIVTFPPPARLLAEPEGGLIAAYIPNDINTLVIHGLVRLLPDGQRDSTFDAGVLDQTRNGGRGDARIVDLLRAPDGGVYVLHYTPAASTPGVRPGPPPPAQVSKIDARGRPLAGFPVTLEVAGAECDRLYVEPDGRFVVVGRFFSAGGRERSGCARFTAQGAVDGSFRAAKSPYGQDPASRLYAAPGGRLLTPLINDRQTPQAAGGQGQLVNLSTRGQVGTGDRIMIAGFVLTAGQNRVLLRAMGPSLTAAGVTGALADPELELVASGGVTVARNDHWRSSQAAEIAATGLAPSDDREAAILAELPPGAYTALVRGAGGREGIAIVEAYLVDGPSTTSPPPARNSPRAINLSTRAHVGTGDKVLIGGFAVRGGAVRAVIRAVGPSLAPFLSGALSGTELRAVRSLGGAQLFTGYDVRQDVANYGPISTAPLVFSVRPGDLQTVVTFPEGNYTVVIEGQSQATGFGLFEIYELP